MRGADVVNGAKFEENHEEMVMVRDIRFFSLCEHHMLPFFGRASIAYIPESRVIGLSKMARITNMFAQRLQLQERLGAQIAEAVEDSTGARGVGVAIEATCVPYSGRRGSVRRAHKKALHSLLPPCPLAAATCV